MIQVRCWRHVTCLLSVSLSPALFAADAVLPLKARAGLPALQYTNAPDALPNYVAGAKWGTQAENINTMQIPLSPEESARHIVLQPGFEAQLFAAEPEIVKPICMAWDERGRLWIAETVDYPNELQPRGTGRDRIKICEDTNGDGKADKFTIFAEQLSIPTGMTFANGGLILIENGHTLFLKDTDGDDKADVRKVLFEGWGTGDTHATASNLRPGFDNWIWGVVGYSGFDGTVAGKNHKFSMGVYRFKADGSALEFIRSSNNNTWGLGLSEEGIVFGSTANNNASWYMPVPNRFYEAVSGWSSSRMETIADSQQIYPITSKVRQVDAHGRYTAGAGHALYTARSFPKEFWNRISFVTEPTGHVVGWFNLEANGADFKAINKGSFMASSDEWTAPIAAEVGPDGAVWVLDWYNYIVQHNPTPSGFKTGKGNAYETPLRDKRHGRIYRVTSTSGKPSVQPKLAGATSAELVAALKNDNQLWRLHAQRLLVERQDASVVPALGELVRNTTPDAAGLNPAAIHALWALKGLGALDTAISAGYSVVQGALKHPSPGVVRAAVQVLPHDRASANEIIGSGALKHADAQVRLAAFLALAECPPAWEIGSEVFVAMQDPANSGDRWIRDAATSAAARHEAGFLPAAIASKEPMEKLVPMLRTLARHHASSAPSDILGLLPKLADSPVINGNALLDGLASGWPEEKPLSLDEKSRGAITSAMQALTPSGREKLLVLVQKWGALKSFPTELAAATKSLRSQIADATLATDARVSAARSLVRLSEEAESTRAILNELTAQTAPQLSFELIRALGESRAAATGTETLAAWSHFTPAQRRGAIELLLRRPEWSGELLAAIEGGSIMRTELGPQNWQQLQTSPDAKLAERAKSIVNGGKKVSADREEIVKKFQPAAAKSGNLARGKEVFTTNCSVCHRFNGAGNNIGPDLTGIGARPKADILTEILDPNRSVEANYRLWTVTTKAGESYAGRLDTETQTSIEILDLAGQKHALQRKEIEKLEASNLSIMPVGFESIGEADLSNLLEYLAGAPH